MSNGMGSGLLDGVMGLTEGGTEGAGILAGLKVAGINASPYAPWILGGSVVANTLGKFLGTSLDAPAERQQFRLGNQQLEIGDLNIKAEKAKQAQDRENLRKQKALQTSLSGIFSEYSRIKGGG